MAQRTPSQIGFVKLSDSDFVLENPEQDIRGKDVYGVDGEHVGGVDDLYIDRQERKVRFLELVAGGFLGIGGKHLLVPVEAITEVGEARVTIEPGRTEKVAGPQPFDTAVRPPTAEHRREGYASIPFGTADGTVDSRRNVSPPFGRRPYP
jgi:sporulation protein YlmC with PRC-barrel domain